MSKHELRSEKPWSSDLRTGVRLSSAPPQSVRKHSFRTDILCHPTKYHPPEAQIRKKRGVFPSDFRDFSDFGHNYPAVAFDELRNAAAEGDGSSDVVAQRREGEFGGDLFLAPAEEMTAVVMVLDGAEGGARWSAGRASACECPAG